jgi:hypothetical protein
MVLPGKRKGAVLADENATSLVEVGPRLALQPIKIFAGSFGGPVLYENPAYVSPNKARACPAVLIRLPVLCCPDQALYLPHTMLLRLCTCAARFAVLMRLISYDAAHLAILIRLFVSMCTLGSLGCRRACHASNPPWTRLEQA